MAVARRKTGKYVDGDWDTKEGIISFLESNGFERTTFDTVQGILRYSKHIGDKPVYSVGDYKSGPTSHWIKFYSPKWPGHVFFCRESTIMHKLTDPTTSRYSILIGSAWNDLSDFGVFREFVREKLGI